MSETTKRGFELSVTALFVLALLLVGAVLIFSDGTASAKQIATLRLLGGEVAVQHGDDALEPGEEGESLREGDIVRTGPDGRAAIEYFDGSLTRLDYDATFSLVTLETLRNPAESKVILGEQTAGNSYNRVTDLTDPESRFEIGTSTATASAQGTVYAVIVDEGSTTIAVAEGLVTASSASGSLGVSAGKMVVVGAGGAIGAVQDISQELLDSDWFAFNQCELDGIRECIENDAEGEEAAGGQRVKETTGMDRRRAPAPATGAPATEEGRPGTVRRPAVIQLRPHRHRTFAGDDRTRRLAGVHRGGVRHGRSLDGQGHRGHELLDRPRWIVPRPHVHGHAHGSAHGHRHLCRRQ